MPTLLLGLLLLLPVGLQAAALANSDMPLMLAAEAPVALSLEEAVAKVQREHGGRILSTETIEEDGQRLHLIKVLTPDNSVRTLRLPARVE